VKAVAVDPPDAAADDRRARSCPEDVRIELLATVFVVLLGVVQAGEGSPLTEAKALDVEEHCRCDQWAGEGAPARLVGASHEATAQRAVEREQPATAGSRAGAIAAGSTRAGCLRLPHVARS
jgi:hypothetical protein